MAGMTKELARLVSKSEQFLQNARSNPEIKTALDKFRFDETQLSAGDGFVADVKQKATANATAHAAQLGATDHFNRLFDETWDQAQSVAELAAVLFEDDTEKLILLALHQKRDKKTGASELAWPKKNRDFSSFLPWARNLYNLAQTNTDISSVLADFYPPDVGQLAEEAAEIEQLVDLDHVQENAKAMNLQSRVDRDEAAAKLKAWRARAEKFARLALKGKPQLLEALGIRGRR